MATETAGSLAGLSIAVIGVGGIGSTFAYHLARAGHAVTVVARPRSARLAQLQRDGGIVLTSGERQSTSVADALEPGVAYDLVLVTLLAQQVDAVLPELQASAAKAVHLMMNQYAPQRIAAALGERRCSFGMPFVQARVDGDGRLDAKISVGQKTLHGDERWRDLFNQAGIASAYEPKMQLWLRCHVPLCCGMESIAYKAVQRGGGATWAEAMVTARGMHGGFAIVQAMGDELYPGIKKVLNAMPDVALAGMVWGLSRNKGFRELLATGVRECRALVDAVGAAAGGNVSGDAVKAFVAMKP